MWSGNIKVKYIILIFKDWRGTRLRVIYNNTTQIVVKDMVRFRKYLGGLSSDGAQVSDLDNWMDTVLSLRKKEHWSQGGSKENNGFLFESDVFIGHPSRAGQQK